MRTKQDDIFIFLFFCLSCIFLFSPLIYTLYVYSGDYKNYVYQYVHGGTGRFEIGYRYLVNYFSLIFERKEEYQFLIFVVITSTLTFFSKVFVVFTLNKKNIISFIISYSIYFLFLHEMNQIRFSIAIGISIWILYFIKAGSYKKSVFVFIISILFHYSMLLFIIPIIVSKFKLYNRPLFLFLIPMCLYLLSQFLLNSGVLNSINPLIDVYMRTSQSYSYNVFYIATILIYFLSSFFIMSMNNEITKVTYFTSVFLFFISLSLIKAPAVSVRIMDFMTFFMLITVHIAQFKFKVFNLLSYVTVYVLAFSKFFIMITANETFKFADPLWFKLI